MILVYLYIYIYREREREEKGKLNVSKHLYQSSRGKINIMPIYQNDDYTLLQILKEKDFIDKFKPKLNKTSTIHTQTEINIHTHPHTYIYIYIYIHTKPFKLQH